MKYDQDLRPDQDPERNRDQGRRRNLDLDPNPDRHCGRGRYRLLGPGLEAVTVTIGRTVFSPARMTEKGGASGISGNPVWMTKMLCRRRNHRLALYLSTLRVGLRRERTKKTREGPITGPTGRAGIMTTVALIAAVVAVMVNPVTVTGSPSHRVRMEMPGRKHLLLVI